MGLDIINITDVELESSRGVAAANAASRGYIQLVHQPLIVHEENPYIATLSFAQGEQWAATGQISLDYSAMTTVAIMARTLDAAPPDSIDLVIEFDDDYGTIYQFVMEPITMSLLDARFVSGSGHRNYQSKFVNVPVFGGQGSLVDLKLKFHVKLPSAWGSATAFSLNFCAQGVPGIMP